VIVGRVELYGCGAHSLRAEPHDLWVRLTDQSI
jgi:hypothetical protein